MVFYTDFTCSVLTPDLVISGDPCTSAASVCPGTQISVTPSAYATWASPSGGIGMPYVLCTDPVGCREPDEVDPSYTATTHRAMWLRASLFAEYEAPDGHAFFANDIGSSGQSHYDELGGSSNFHEELADYYEDIEGTWYYDRVADGNVFCRGNLQTRYQSGSGGDSVDTTELVGSSPTIDPVTITLSDTGIYTIDTRILDGACFAAAAKLPLERGTNRFVLYYFGYNTPSVPMATTSSPSITVTEGTCDVDFVSSSAEGTLLPGESIVVTVLVHNTGDIPASVESVSATTAGFTAQPLNCTDAGIPAWACPGPSQFGTTIDPDSSRELLVHLRQDVGATGCPDLELEFECSAGGGCGGASGGSGTIPFDLCDAMSCEVEPDPAEIPQGEETPFTVTCFNLGGIEMECPPGIWALRGLLGDLRDASSSGVNVVVDSSPDSTGTLEYNCGDTCPPCHSDLTVVRSRLDCWIEPSGAEIEIGDSEDFDVFCEYDGDPVIPDSA
ncbi:TPA: hypothetical protein EYP38_01020, partial [Candidatus Micrarchaeota archaeon]|nr:hypothetical protein [Candidatus Micrarchaeota archaeon]